MTTINIHPTAKATTRTFKLEAEPNAGPCHCITFGVGERDTINVQVFVNPENAKAVMEFAAELADAAEAMESVS